jgi:hypothetical protein
MANKGFMAGGTGKTGGKKAAAAIQGMGSGIIGRLTARNAAVQAVHQEAIRQTGKTVRNEQNHKATRKTFKDMRKAGAAGTEFELKTKTAKLKGVWGEGAPKKKAEGEKSSPVSSAQFVETRAQKNSRSKSMAEFNAKKKAAGITGGPRRSASIVAKAEERRASRPSRPQMSAISAATQASNTDKMREFNAKKKAAGVTGNPRAPRDVAGRKTSATRPTIIRSLDQSPAETGERAGKAVDQIAARRAREKRQAVKASKSKAK